MTRSLRMRPSSSASTLSAAGLPAISSWCRTPTMTSGFPSPSTSATAWQTREWAGPTCRHQRISPAPSATIAAAIESEMPDPCAPLQ